MSASHDFLYRRRHERFAMTAFLVVLAGLWSLPLIAAVARGFAFNGVQNFIDVLTLDIGGVSLLRTYFNSFVIAITHALVVVAISALAGYGFTFFEFRGKEAFYSLVLIFMAVPLTSILIPLFFITREANLRDTLVGVALPEAAMTLPFGVLLMRNYAESLPRTLIEAALIDGASHCRVFLDIFVPLSKPALINLGALSVMWSLQDFLLPSLFLTDVAQTTAAQAVLRFKEVLGATPTGIGRYNASLVLLAAPALLVVLFGLRFITQGLTAGGVKE
ncbi:carbohydrate ABC transporter permease [Rhizobium hidalgonense]|uniref:sn-glycerol-3-phosphate transport system permease protein UgpE n=1 Tax=Rhizobium hidalgonense TaxID=1538159 RepID=A0AAJ2LM16_9HYPH|nr:carbohydrate ABC transporter permease [Rhizobium hidalgonense]MDR9777120.1 carbohydrate ABC transporter permease [Rhizobium hidalgonense]MDR9823416.1 carbohydrate ABC transporter permease [Rhizobium hidalgonense]